jgi:hypothetical protein
MAVCRTIDEVLAAADADGANDPPLSQAQADFVAAIFAAGGAEPASPRHAVNGDHDARDG